MNLETQPAGTKIRIGALVSAGDIRPAAFDCTYHVDGSPEETAAVLQTISDYQGKLWIVNGLDTGQLKDNQESGFRRYFRYPYLGSMGECLASELRLACWERLQALGAQNAAITVTVQPVVPSDDEVVVAALGEIAVFKIAYEFGEGFKETCETCVQGRTLLRHGQDWFNGSVHLNHSQDGTIFFGCHIVSPETAKCIGNPIHSAISGDTIQTHAKHCFTEANAGALEMASVTQVFFIGT
ncbi:hypothetical protein FDI24_gp243 [Acidovorax phage ACP17]|uniref:Uncharacterized protein n=1 Tax=Acidovorax phage ACP17 TaxID=2010329 RepID=A0A218M3A1_9CAUD|nr:hypothetical protein FDI24_gp243 [Acidovorax phage ACP17]ASD50524.1 hypothetical protein [Acidovorax phage ACP17]